MPNIIKFSYPVKNQKIDADVAKVAGKNVINRDGSFSISIDKVVGLNTSHSGATLGVQLFGLDSAVTASSQRIPIDIKRVGGTDISTPSGEAMEVKITK